jgi:IMP cyclohydrolase
MATTNKAVNYSAEQTADAIAQYATGASIDAIATALGKSTRSVIAKLSREGVYKAKEYKTKTGGTVIAKETFVELIANALNVDTEKLGGLEKANKATLEIIYKALVE